MDALEPGSVPAEWWVWLCPKARSDEKTQCRRYVLKCYWPPLKAATSLLWLLLLVPVCSGHRWRQPLLYCGYYLLPGGVKTRSHALSFMTYWKAVLPLLSGKRLLWTVNASWRVSPMRSLHMSSYVCDHWEVSDCLPYYSALENYQLLYSSAMPYT